MDKKILGAIAEILVASIKQAESYSDACMTYQELSRKIKQKTALDIDPRSTAGFIGHLSEECNKMHLPLISCIVVNKDTFSPGKGFFKLYEKIYNEVVKNDEEPMIFVSESQKVFECVEWEKLLSHYDINEKNDAIISINNPIYEDEYLEGEDILANYKTKSRDSKVIRDAKNSFMKKHGRLFCEVCGFDFSHAYGELGKGFIEGHHEKPVSKMKPGDTTKIKDIRMLCCNCHRMIHRRNDEMSIEELVEIINYRSKV